MPRIRPEFETGSRGALMSLATAGRLLTRAGVVVALTAAPLALVTFLLVLADAPSVSTGLDSAIAATGGPSLPVAASGGSSTSPCSACSPGPGYSAPDSSLPGWRTGRPRRPVWTHRPARWPRHRRYSSAGHPRRGDASSRPETVRWGVRDSDPLRRRRPAFTATTTAETARHFRGGDGWSIQ